MGALGAAYVSAADYRARVKGSDTGKDEEIDAQALAVSHYVDLRVRRRDGFNQSASAETRTYDIGRASGADVAVIDDDPLRLILPDDIATATGLVVKVDLNGDYDITDADETLVKDTDFWLGPANAAAGSEPMPFEYLDIHPDSALISYWPVQRRALAVTAKFGFPSVPAAIKELVVAIVRQLRDIHEAGSTAELQAIDNIVQTTPELNRLMFNIERMYDKGQSF